jgi:hypothetical protein
MYLPQTIERVTLRSAARSRRRDVRVHVFAFSGLPVMIGGMDGSSRRFAEAANLLTMTPAAHDSISGTPQPPPAWIFFQTKSLAIREAFANP